jgi:transcriptional regulator with XRE-family HTH domain
VKRAKRRKSTAKRLEKSALNLVGPQVRKWRDRKGWSQELLATKLQLRGWSISRDSVANLELQRRRVADCEMLFLARVLGVALEDLFPGGLALSKLGPQFQAGGKLSVFPTRSEK